MEILRQVKYLEERTGASSRARSSRFGLNAAAGSLASARRAGVLALAVSRLDSNDAGGGPASTNQSQWHARRAPNYLRDLGSCCLREIAGRASPSSCEAHI